MKIMLFTTNTCPHCEPAKELLKNSKVTGIEYINASENMELTKEFEIRSVPTLVVSKCSGNQHFVGVDEIKNFIKSMEDGTGCGCGCGTH